MSRRTRLDAELVRRGLAKSRQEAADFIEAGLVSVAGQQAGKSATQVGTDAAIVVASPGREPGYASRGGQKLAGALAAFAGPPLDAAPAAEAGTDGARGAEAGADGAQVPGMRVAGLRVTGRRCLDAGASTGGFTDVLLRAGAAHVVAVDVGHGQLAWNLRTDPRVTVLDGVNVRNLTSAQVAPPPGLITADLSFISLALVIPPLVACADPDADFVLMVKPQFEVGKDKVGQGGVVKDPALRAAAVMAVAAAALKNGLGTQGVVASSLPGPAGNVEYFLWLRRGADALDSAEAQRAIAEGPQ
jgi:23S rRNA (cytidine1920-2'-O)/16S rRNA (cytidine1409-2'-O)-methyltransferase